MAALRWHCFCRRGYSVTSHSDAGRESISLQAEDRFLGGDAERFTVIGVCSSIELFLAKVSHSLNHSDSFQLFMLQSSPRMDFDQRRFIPQDKKAGQWFNEIGAPASGNTARRQVHAPDKDLKPGIWTANSLLC